MKSGILYLIPNTLGESSIERVIPNEVITLISTLKTFIVEDIRTARRFLKKVNPSIVIDDLTFLTLDKHTSAESITPYIKSLLKGENMGVISEAGVPCIADPGNIMVTLAHEHNIEVIPMVGPSSILLAMIASGLNGQNFAFNGYLPLKNPERALKIKQLEQRSKKENQSQIFIETPYRNDQIFSDLLFNLTNTTRLTIAVDISLDTQWIKTQTMGEWKTKTPQNINKRPAIFIFQA